MSRLLRALMPIGLAVACSLMGSCAKSVPPDIFLITVDTLRADRLGCYGYGGASTPTFDALASRGLRFANCVSPVPITLPAHASILTGQLPLEHGVRNNGTYRLDAAIPTLAELLAESGYATGAFVGAFPLDSRFGLDRGFQVYDDDVTQPGSRVFDYSERPGGQVIARALNWLKTLGDEPAFVWVHLFEPHAPYSPPPPFDTQFAGRLYDGEVAAVDAIVGEWLEKATSVRGRPRVVALTSDHGEGLGEHGEDTHSFFLYETTQHVPLILEGAGVPTRVENEPVGLWDVAPTLATLAGIDASRLSGSGIALPLESAPPSRELIMETMAGNESCGWSPMFAVRRGSRKAIRSARSWAFDLQADPVEQADLLSTAPWASDLLSSLEANVRELVDASSGNETSADRQPTAAEQEALAALGYAGAVPRGASPDSDALFAFMDERPDATERVDALKLATRAQGDIVAKRFLLAVQKLETVLEQNPHNAWARGMLAGSYRELGRVDDALAEFGRLVVERPAWLEARVNLARLQVGSGQKHEATLSFERALELDPSNGDVLREAVRFFLSQADYDGMGRALDAAWKSGRLVDRDWAFVHEGYARLFLRSGRYADGEPHVKKAREFADRPDLVLLHATYLEKQGKSDELRTVIQQGVEAFPSHGALKQWAERLDS